MFGKPALAAALVIGYAGWVHAQSAPPRLSKIDAQPPPITTEQTQRLAEKLQLIDEIARSVDRDLAATDPSANTRKWLIDALLPLSLEQLHSIGTPGTLAATTGAIDRARARANQKALGSVSADLTYTPFAPCRFIDTRNVGGKISGSRQFNVASDGVTYGGAGGCAPVTVSGAAAASDVAALAVNVTIVDTSAAGSPGFATVRPAGSTAVTALVNWTTSAAGFQLGNAAVVTSSQGAPNQFEIVTSGSVHVIVDVFGAFLRPGATLLDCSDAGTLTGLPIAANSDLIFQSQACPAGRFPVGGECYADHGLVNLVRSWNPDSFSTTSVWECAFRNYDSFQHNVNAYQVCCKVPGR